MSLAKHLRREIQKTGYPLEIEISSLLDGKWDKIVNTDSYRDYSENKTRDIDINAYRIVETGIGLEFAPHLIIECKKSENLAWVFFMRPLKLEDLDLNGHYLDGLQAKDKKVDNISAMKPILNSSKLHYKRFKRAAVCFSEFYMQGKQNESHKKEIFEAETQLKKFIIDKNELTMKSEGYPLFVDFYFPCIVFDGKMFEATVKNGKTRLKESFHVPLLTSHPSPYSTWDLGFVVDVVHKSYFEKFSDLVNQDIDNLTSTMQHKVWKTLDTLGLAANEFFEN